ncbi:LOW QUALITY PROTEIN: integrin alpha-7, partial [Meleagris gallopavo]|uniref:LOW QUALITY PROTEIN: integrin alpha-7 n=2 Tax=Meleagris gallopavo TaxID=9103 RepID=UPI0012ABB9E9
VSHPCRLLVGAPQAPALPSQAANRTGGLFACPLTPEPSDCWRVPIDEGVDLQRESKENQWLGVSVKSQGAGGKIVTCAHRYEARNRVQQPLETRDVIGRCFVLSQDLRVHDELDGGEWKFCEGRPQGHDRFGFCQQGLAAAFSPDQHYVLFGAPGTYNWKGNMRVELLNQSSLDLLRYDDGPYEAGGEKDQDPSLIPVPANSYFGLLFVTNIDSSDPDQLVYKSPDPNEKVPGAAGDVPQNSYLGFSVDSGAGLTRRRELSFVSGAPRANHTGAVVILRRDSAHRLVPEAVLPGEQLTSAFGYALAVLDLNSDGWMDLVVGAPHFFERKAEIGGAAYVYINPAGHWDAATPLRLTGTHGSMFGIALGSAGDLNLDGFEDLAVGAPFDGAGKVYIYHGSKLGIVVKPAQVLDGEGVGVTTFGYALSGGVDVDGNLYPDLLVGSLSDTVVLYRARPVVYISRNVSLLPANIDLEQSNCQHQEGICVDESQGCWILGQGWFSGAEIWGGDGAGSGYPRDAGVWDELVPCGLRVCWASGQGRFQGFWGRLGSGMGLVPGVSGVLEFEMAPCPQDKPVVCLANQNGSQVECELGNPMKRGAQVRFYLILSTLGITLQTTDLAVELALSTISEQPTLEPVVARARVVIELPLSVTGVAVPPRLFFGGTVRGESAVRRESQVGSAVLFEVTVSNRGPSLKTLGSAFLNLLWPHELSNGKWLLYPLQLELLAAPGLQTVCSPAANPLRLALEPPGEAEVTEEPAVESWWVPAPAERRRNVTLDCAQGTARCMAFRCPLYSFERAAVLTARGRLWNSTFLEEYLAVTSVELIVRASVSVTSSIKNLVLKDASTQIPVTIYLDPGVAVAGGVPWWVILLAVLAGILVLALLIFILWKLGFFRRARYVPPAVPQYHAVKIPREERQQFREEKMGTIQRKEWAVNWSEPSDGHVTPSSA